MKISFCTTCMGRAHHLKETLLRNIEDNSPSEDFDVEFVVLNYNSKDDLHDWITSDPVLSQHIESGLIRYGRTTEPEHFHMAHAKNMAHRMATGDVLCNLDADNFAGKGFARFLHEQFSKDMDTLLRPSFRASRLYAPEERGFGGKIALSRDNYFELGGYDETYQGWGNEDNDFVIRAKGSGLKQWYFENSKFIEIIHHSNEERGINMADAENAIEDVNYKQKHETKLSKVLRRIGGLSKPVQANNGTDFGMGRVQMAGSEDLVLGKVPNKILSPFNICAIGLPELVRGRLSPRVAHSSHNNDEIRHDI